MRLLILILSLLWSLPAFAEGSYIIVLDGVEYPITLDGSTEAKSKSGETLSLQLKRKEFSTYVDGAMSFEHKSENAVAVKDLDDETRQHLLVTSTGTLILLQTYKTTIPSEVVDLMVKELTDEEVAAGAKMEQQDHTRTLSDGTVMKGKFANLKTDNDNQNLTVMAFDAEVGGVLAITSIDLFTSPEDQPIIDKFWSTFKVKN